MLRADGQPLTLTWDVFFYTVVIRSFEADYRSGWWIPYRVAWTVLRDEAGAAIDTALSFATSAVSDIATAVGQALAGGMDLSSAQALMSAPQATTQGTAAFGSAQSSLQSAQSTLGGTIASAESTLGTASSQLASARAAQDGITALRSATSGAQQLSALTAARGYVGRAALNFAYASS